MGFYIAIKDDRGCCIHKDKYGIGMPLLMFAKNPMNETRSINTKGNLFCVNGNEAIKNLQDVLNYIDTHPAKKESERINDIKKKLWEVLAKLHSDRVYTCDYTEGMMYVNNPEYSIENYIIELVDVLEDILTGYYEFGKEGMDDLSLRTQQYLNDFSEDVFVSFVWKSNKKFIVYGVQVDLSNEEKELIRKRNPRVESERFCRTFMVRKIHRTLAKSGFEFEVCKAPEENTFYLIIDREPLEKWYAKSPYVECSYRTETTYDIRYSVRNTPQNLEDFICFAKESGKDKLVSIIVNNVQILGLSNVEISAVIGKYFIEHPVFKNKIDMAYKN